MHLTQGLVFLHLQLKELPDLLVDLGELLQVVLQEGDLLLLGNSPTSFLLLVFVLVGRLQCNKARRQNLIDVFNFVIVMVVVPVLNVLIVIFESMSNCGGWTPVFE